jgi:formate dehydrogenase iron-sulfur subunit
MVACPFGVPKYEWSKAFPLVKKCTGCYSRVKAGLQPACATACPTAITYGTRGEMLKEAERRIMKRPDRYFKTIYGKEEAGGTGVLYLTHQPLDELGFKPVTKRPLPSYTWQALRLVPGIFLTVGGTLSMVSWLQHRKDRIRKEEEMERGIGEEPVSHPSADEHKEERP